MLPWSNGITDMKDKRYQLLWPGVPALDNKKKVQYATKSMGTA